MTITEAIRQQRKGGVGGSDAGGILGVSKRSSALTIFDSKTLDLPNKTLDIFWYGNEGERMVSARIWHDLRAAKNYRGKSLIEPPGMMWHPNGWAFANPDRVLVDKKTGKWLEGYECKWVINRLFEWSKPGERDRYPAAYYAQAFHYLWVARANGHDLNHWWVVAMLGGGDTRYYKVPWDEEFAAVYEKALHRFWHQYVVPGTPPPPTAFKGDRDSLNRRFREEKENTIKAPAGLDTNISRYGEVDRQIKALEKEREQIRNDLRFVLGSSNRIEGEGWHGTLKAPRSRQRIDYKGLIKAAGLDPKEIQRFTREEKPSRILRITIKEKENGTDDK